MFTSTAFLPTPSLPSPQNISTKSQQPRLSHKTSQSTISRRTLISIALSLPLTTLLPPTQATPIQTHTVFFDISVAGKPSGRIIIALFGEEAPDSVDTFTKLAQGTLRNRAGKTATFKYSQASRVLKSRYITLGHIKQIDALNQQSGIPQRQTVGVQIPPNNDYNLLRHDAPGIVSVKRGGSFEFSITLAPDPDRDQHNVVVGRVVDGMHVVQRLGTVPTNRKTIRDGYRAIGKVIGDARAKVDLEDKPLQKIQITNCGIL